MLKHYVAQLLSWYQDRLQEYGNAMVGFMMLLESTLVPIPSETIIPPAAHFAYTHPGGKLSIAGIIIAGTLGSWLGASIMYWLAYLAGRPLLFKYGRYVMMPKEKIEGAERWAKHYGAAGVFISRLLPVIRHLIGIPMGLVRMDFKLYSLFTILGSGMWCAILCWLGVRMGQDEQLMNGEYHQIIKWIVPILLVLGGIYYFFVYRQMKKPVRELPK